MTTLDIAISLGLSPKKVSSSHGGEYASACPVCGGNDRFRVWPEKKDGGAWWCRAEDKGGDAIALLMHAKNMSFKEACDYIGRELPAKRRSRTPAAPRKASVEFTPRHPASPSLLWQQRAADLAGACYKVLLKTPDQLAWLEARGITLESVTRFRLGWNTKTVSRKRAEWGVENETVTEDGAPKVLDLLVLHRGLVIPYIVGDSIESLRIRRPEEGLDNRYHAVKGSASKPMMIHCLDSAARGAGAWIVVESRLDAILIAQDAGDIVNAAAIDSVSTKPAGALYDELKRADHIMVCLDYDAPGGRAKKWWAEYFPQTERWIVPRGKDPGDYRKEGGDIRAWIIAGLPYGLRPAPPQVCHSERSEESRKTVPAEKEAEPDKKAGLPVSEENLIGHVIDDLPCDKCRRNTVTVLWPKTGRRPPVECGPCTTARWEREVEKKEKRYFKAGGIS